MDDIFLMLFLISVASIFAFLVAAFISLIRRKSAKKMLIRVGVALIASVVCFIGFGISSDNAEKTEAKEDGEVVVEVEEEKVETKEYNEEEKVEEVCLHEWKETKRNEPTLIAEGVSYQKCDLCGEKKEDIVDKLVQTVTLEELYTEFENNELRAKDMYSGQYFIIDGIMEGVEDSGLLNIGGGATLTIKHSSKFGNLWLIASFEKNNVEPLKALDKGDYVRVYGRCNSWGSWGDCQLLLEE